MRIKTSVLIGFLTVCVILLSSGCIEEEYTPSAPQDWVDAIEIDDNRISFTREFGELQILKVTETHSMIPTMDSNHHVICDSNVLIEDLKIGDIILFNLSEERFGYDRAGHRIVEISNDINGWFAITKGDNNEYRDSQKVRSEEFICVVVAVIY